MKKAIIIILAFLCVLPVLDAQISPTLVVDYFKGPDSHTDPYISHPFFPVVFKNKYYYVGRDSNTGHELCVSGGDSASTKMVVDYIPGYDGMFDYYEYNTGIIFGNYMLFDGSVSPYNTELLKSDGTAAGTSPLRDFNGSYSGSYPSGLAVFNKHLFVGFTIVDTNYNSLSYIHIFDSTLNIVDSIVGFSIANPFIFKNELYYSAHFDSSDQFGIIKIDSNFKITKHFCRDTFTNYFYEIGVLDSVVLFSSYSNSKGEELYYFQSDSIRFFKDINPGNGSSNSGNFMRYNNKLIFSAKNDTYGQELWISDGTANGTNLLKDISIGSDASYPSGFVLYKDEVFFVAFDTTYGCELWKTDGSTSGTKMVKDIFKEVYSFDKYNRDVKNLFVHNNKLYFSAVTDKYGFELFVSKGDSASIKMVADINTDTTDSENPPRNFITYNKQFYFQAYSPDLGYEWYQLADTLDENKPVIANILGKDTTSCGPYTISVESKYKSVVWSNTSTNKTVTFVNSGLFYIVATDSSNNKFIDSIQITINTLPIFSLGKDTVVCGSYSIASPSGYTNLWSNYSTGSSLKVNNSGTYWLEVKDNNGCKSQDTIQVTINSLPIFSLGKDTVDCGPYSITSPSGYTNLWSNYSTGSSLKVNNSGTYWLEVKDNNGCKSQDTIQVTINALPIFSLGKDTILCNTLGFKILAPLGFKYMWSNGDTSIQVLTQGAGIYSVKLADKNNCSYSDTIEISQAELPVLNIKDTFKSCNSAIVTLDYNYQYYWNNIEGGQDTVINSTQTLNILVKSKDACMLSKNIFVEISKPAVNSSILYNSNLLDFSFSINNYDGISSVKWRFGDSDSSSLTNPQYSFKQSGTYLVQLFLKNECGSFVFDTVVNVKDSSNTSITKEFKNQLEIYPNPANDVITIKGLSDKMVLNVYDSNGRLLVLKQENETVFVRDLADGVYQFVVFDSVNKLRFTKKIVIQR